MSTPSTPARSNRALEAGTPASARSDLSDRLAAYLKRQHELDDLENGIVEGDEESEAPASRSRPVKKTEVATLYQDDVGSDEDDDDDDMPVMKSKGRMAARMQSRAKDTPTTATLDVNKPTRSPTPSEQAGLSSPTAPSTRQASPGLFVSPAKSTKDSTATELHNGEGSDSELPVNPLANARFQELVARKRAQREAREAEQEREKRNKRAEDIRRDMQKKIQRKQNTSRELAAARKEIAAIRREKRKLGMEVTADDEADIEASHLLTQETARPARKASKRALEEMTRETQRMNRNMQLAHEAKTKKKFTTSDLLARFNFRQQENKENLPKEDAASAEHSAVSAPVSSDVEASKDVDTPPTSPPSREESTKKVHSAQTIVQEPLQIEHTITAPDNDDALPDLAELLAQSKKLNKGKGRASQHQIRAKEIRPKHVRVSAPAKLVGLQEIDLDSDDEEFSAKDSKRSRFAAFDNLQGKKSTEPRSMLNLRALAHLTSPTKTFPKNRKSINPAELQAALQRRARRQAERARLEHIEDLKRRGILIQTEEDIEREQLLTENTIEQARIEAANIRKKEKELAKQNGEEDEANMLPSEDEDEDYEGSDEEEGDIELSGSEEEGGDGEEMRDGAQPLFDQEADEDEATDENDDDGEASTAEEAHDAVDAEDSEDETIVARRSTTKSKARRVVDDEEEEIEEVAAASAPRTSNNATQKSEAPADETAAAFGFALKSSAPLGLSQAFAGTMADLQGQTQDDLQIDQEQDSLAFLRELPRSSAPVFDATMPDQSQDLLIGDSQSGFTQASVQEISLGLSQLPDTQPFGASQDVPEPTQDQGFASLRSPSTFQTQETVMIPVPESPAVSKPKGRLVRKEKVVDISSAESESELSVEEAADNAPDADVNIQANAFDVLKKGAKKQKRNKQIDDFNKKASEAKGMVEEQAVESEDEYAGIGGASDDESGSDMDEETKKMVDDRKLKINARDEAEGRRRIAELDLAKYEQDVSKLHDDVVNHRLGKRRGGMDDLDSDEEIEMQRIERRRAREAAQRKLILDAVGGKIAKNKKNDAFLATLEDKDGEDANYLSDDGEDGAEADEPVSVPDTQQKSDNEVEAEDQAQAAQTTLKRKRSDTTGDSATRLPPAQRCKPASNSRVPPRLSVRESIASLLEDPVSIPATQLSEDDEDDDEEQGNDETAEETDDDLIMTGAAPFIPSLRTAATEPSRPLFKDRLTLSRQSTSSSTTSTTDAFAAIRPSAFKVPALLRRATTNLSTMSATSTSSESSSRPQSAAGGEGGLGVKRGGSSKSNIHYQAREAERRKVLDEGARKREEAKRKEAKRATGAGMLRGLSSMSGFE